MNRTMLWAMAVSVLFLVAGASLWTISNQEPVPCEPCVSQESSSPAPAAPPPAPPQASPQPPPESAGGAPETATTSTLPSGGEVSGETKGTAATAAAAAPAKPFCPWLPEDPAWVRAAEPAPPQPWVTVMTTVRRNTTAATEPTYSHGTLANLFMSMHDERDWWLRNHPQGPRTKAGAEMACWPRPVDVRLMVGDYHPEEHQRFRSMRGVTVVPLPNPAMLEGRDVKQRAALNFARTLNISLELAARPNPPHGLLLIEDDVVFADAFASRLWDIISEIDAAMGPNNTVWMLAAQSPSWVPHGGAMPPFAKRDAPFFITAKPVNFCCLQTIYFSLDFAVKFAKYAMETMYFAPAPYPDDGVLGNWIDKTEEAVLLRLKSDLSQHMGKFSTGVGIGTAYVHSHGFVDGHLYSLRF